MNDFIFLAALSMMPLKIIFMIALVATLLSGIYMVKNYNRLFGVDPETPQETSGERTYSKAQMIICWLISMKLLLMMIFML